MSHPPPPQARCRAHPERRHHLAGTATQREQARARQTHIRMDIVAAPRPLLLVAQQPRDMDMEVGPAQPRMQIWRQLYPPTLPLWSQVGLALWWLSLCNVTSRLLLTQFPWADLRIFYEIERVAMWKFG